MFDVHTWHIANTCNRTPCISDEFFVFIFFALFIMQVRIPFDEIRKQFAKHLIYFFVLLVRHVIYLLHLIFVLLVSCTFYVRVQCYSLYSRIRICSRFMFLRFLSPEIKVGELLEKQETHDKKQYYR